MKPASFEYFAPTSLDEALSLLSEHGDEGKVLAGGVSLVPLMNFRLSRPASLIDINRLPNLDYIREVNGSIAIGALTRHATVEHSPIIKEKCPLLAHATTFIGHMQIRNRGTFGGSIAHADPVAELPLVATLLDAEIVARSEAGERVIRPEEFFLTYLTTSLEPNELVTEVRIPKIPAGIGWEFNELARKHGDFAMVMVGTLVRLNQQGVCEEARVALAGMGPTPLRASAVEEALAGQPMTEEVIRGAAELARSEGEPEGDVHASADYKRHLAGVLTRRALLKAVERARA